MARRCWEDKLNQVNACCDATPAFVILGPLPSPNFATPASPGLTGFFVAFLHPSLPRSLQSLQPLSTMSTSLPILSQLPHIKTRELHIARQAAAYLIFPYSFSKSLEPLQEHTMPIHRHVVRRRLPCHFLGFILILTYLASLLVSFLYDKCFGKPLTSPLTDKIFPVMYGYGGMLVLENICFTRQIVYFRRYGWRTMLNYYTQYTFVCFFMPTRRYEIPCLDCIHLGHTCPRCAQLQGD